MAMFPTHIKCSTLAGIVGGIAANVGYGVPPTTAAVGGGLCCIGGILPDIDSGPGIPLREITTFLASVVPTMLITRLLAHHFTQESLILTGAIIYVAIRFGLSHFLRHYTVHRGMFHSFPSMAIFGELTYLLFYGETMFVRIFMVCSVCLGFFIHLLLDEIYSVEWDGKPRLKKSFGTAMKFVGNGWWPNVTCYVKLAILTYFVMNDPSVIQQLYAGNGTQVAQSLGESVKEQFDSAVTKTRAKSSGFNPLAMVPGGAPPGQAPAGPQYAAPVAANSSTVPPPGIAWPASSANNSYPVPAAAQQYGAPSPYAATMPANQPAANPPATNGLYAPAGNGAAPSAAPAQAGARGRFWQ
jgi:membrane-bound metal-dependent hydrolase YbcI (DUF457 family)